MKTIIQPLLSLDISILDSLMTDQIKEAVCLYSTLRDHNGEIEDFEYKYINRAGAAELGLEPGQMIGRRISEMLPNVKQSQIFSAYVDSARRGVRHALKDVYYKDMCSEHQVKGYYNLFITPVPGGLLISWRNVHEKIDLEGMLFRQNKALLFEREKLQSVARELEDARDLYQIIGETLPYGIWMCDTDGRAKYMSQSFLDLVEMTLEEASGFGWAKRLHPDTVDAMFEKIKLHAETGEPWDHVNYILGPDGRYHYVLSRGRPIRDKYGKITAWAGINLDIDELKRTQLDLQGNLEE